MFDDSNNAKELSDSTLRLSSLRLSSESSGLEAEARRARRSLTDEDADFLLKVRGTSVLLVEDSAYFRAYVTRMIELSGGRVDCAENGLEGIKAALANHYDVILMDICMPRLDGFEATRKLREWGYEGSIVALTGTEPASMRDSCVEAGFDELLLKPVHRVRLLYTIACRPRNFEESREGAKPVH